MERPGADSEEKREPGGDIDTALVDSLKALDPNRPISMKTALGTDPITLGPLLFVGLGCA